jgi:hypothetical protein
MHDRPADLHLRRRGERVNCCLHCGATTSNGLALCELCRHGVTVKLEFLPVYFGNLARWRPPARPNGSMSGSGQWLIRRGDSEGSRIGQALSRSANDLATWARALADDRGTDEPVDGETESATVVLLCEWLTGNLTSIATLEWAGQFVRDIDRHEARLRALTEASIPGWYAGMCGRRIAMKTADDDGLCGAATYVVPGLTWVTCGACGSTTYARDHLDAVIDEAREWIDRPMRLAEAAVALIDTEQSIPRLHKRISKWGEREQIEPLRKVDIDGDPTGPKRFRFGDVLTMLFTEGATRVDEPDATEDVPAC